MGWDQLLYSRCCLDFYFLMYKYVNEFAFSFRRNYNNTNFIIMQLFLLKKYGKI